MSRKGGVGGYTERDKKMKNGQAKESEGICVLFVQNVGLYANSQMKGSDFQEFERHLETCEICQEYLKSFVDENGLRST